MKMIRAAVFHKRRAVFAHGETTALRLFLTQIPQSPRGEPKSADRTALAEHWRRSVENAMRAIRWGESRPDEQPMPGELAAQVEWIESDCDSHNPLLAAHLPGVELRQGSAQAPDARSESLRAALAAELGAPVIDFFGQLEELRIGEHSNFSGLHNLSARAQSDGPSRLSISSVEPLLARVFAMPAFCSHAEACELGWFISAATDSGGDGRARTADFPPRKTRSL